jgi:protein-S-isoprenylcysteine O-methyltransferase Ste14
MLKFVVSLTTKAAVATILFYAATAAIYFFAAGRWDLPLAWVYFVLNFLVGLLLVLVLGVKDPGLLQERLKPGPGEQDKVYRPAGTIFSIITLVVAGMDVGRLHWSSPVPVGLQVIANLLVFAGLLILTWAMFENSFFSLAVRLQADRNQVPVTTGPYALVRHPGYFGGVLYLVFTGPALGSWWATLVSIPMLALTIRRILLEDLMLREGLPGYSEYAAGVRFRLIPGVW